MANPGVCPGVSLYVRRCSMICSTDTNWEELPGWIERMRGKAATQWKTGCGIPKGKECMYNVW